MDLLCRSAAFYFSRQEPQTKTTGLRYTPSRHVIAMELLEGQTLKQRLVGPGLAPARPPQGVALQIDTLLDVAIQIADALDAAHSAGVPPAVGAIHELSLRRWALGQ